MTCRGCDYSTDTPTSDVRGDINIVWECWRVYGSPETRAVVNDSNDYEPPACTDRVESEPCGCGF